MNVMNIKKQTVIVLSALYVFSNIFIAITVRTGTGYADRATDFCNETAPIDFSNFGTTSERNAACQRNARAAERRCYTSLGSSEGIQCVENYYNGLTGTSSGSGSSSDISIQRSLCGKGAFYNRNVLGIPVWYKYLDGDRDTVLFSNGDERVNQTSECNPTLRGSDGKIDPNAFLAIGLVFLEAGLVLAGIIAVGMVVWGSFKFILSQGEPDKAAGARKTVINAAIGLVIVIVAARVISFIAMRLT